MPDEPGQTPIQEQPTADTVERQEPPKVFDEAYVKALRQEAAQYRTQLKELAAKAEKGSELEKQLQQMIIEKDSSDRRAAFFESASAPGVGCINPKAAYLVASAEGLFRKDGTPDWPALQTTIPELFRRPGQANAGAGTGAPPPAQPSMNDFIRRAAGRS